MRLKKNASRLLGAICALATVACVDSDFDLSDVSSEVTIGSGSTTLPLGYLENKTIGDLIGNQTFEGLDKDENGNYVFTYDGEAGNVSIEGIPAEFVMEGIQNELHVDYPDLTFTMDPIEFEVVENIDVDEKTLADINEVIETIHKYEDKIPDGYYDVNEYIESMGLPAEVSGTYATSINSEQVPAMNINVELPEMVKNVDRIYFADGGAPLDLNIDLNDIAGINGGGYVNFSLAIKGGAMFRLVGANEDVDVIEDKIYIAEGEESVNYEIRIESIANATELVGGVLNLPLALDFDMAYEIATNYMGLVDADKLEEMPKVSVNAKLECDDAEFTLDTSKPLLEYPFEVDAFEFEIPTDEVKIQSINHISLKEGSVLSLSINGLDWLIEGEGNEIADKTNIVLDLPAIFEFDAADGHNYMYDAETGCLIASIADLAEGVQIDVKGLNFGDEGLVPEDGKVVIDGIEPKFMVNFTGEEPIRVSDLAYTGEGQLKLDLNLSDIEFVINSVSGVVEFSHNVVIEQSLADIKDSFDDTGLAIGDLGIKPIVEVDVANPLTIAAFFNGSILPILDGEVVEENVVEFNVPIAAAEYDSANEVVIPNATTLVIADESLRSKYDDAKYTFVACDVTKLLRGEEFPDMLKIELNLGIEPEVMHTVYISETLSVDYDYKIVVPIALDESLEIKYDGVVNNIGSTFQTLADYDIKMGDVVLVATVTNTSPLQFEPKVQLLDKDGKPTEAQVVIEDGTKILGSNDGVTPAESKVRLVIDLGKGGRVSNLAKVDGVAVELTASSAAEDSSVPLKDEQYVGVRLHLELLGGITVNLGQF